MLMKFLGWIKWFTDNCLSSNSAISFGRTVSMMLVIYFMVMDYLFFRIHHTFIDNSTMLTQLAVMTSFYGVNKTHDAIKGTTNNTDPHV